MSWIDTAPWVTESGSPSRLQLHYGAYILASAAHSLIEHASDDSHTNLGISRGSRSLVTRDLRVGLALHLDVEPFALALRNGHTTVASHSLGGQTLDGALSWIEKTLATQGLPVSVVRREFPDFPESPLMSNGEFDTDGAVERGRLFTWLRNADEILNLLGQSEAGMSEARVWPHHFDLGALISVSQGASRSIGVGFSLGDSLIPEPYFYCYPTLLPQQRLNSPNWYQAAGPPIASSPPSLLRPIFKPLSPRKTSCEPT